ncbi:MAG TPA: DUF2147 domain-containing protein [Smithellaceae bacterium]|nr:DUF2147 domain-containing protein [Smithellaceae bacterium]HRV43712.1 DUF2147 domain-containing protein [Smithellaceae bacterium]
MKKLSCPKGTFGKEWPSAVLAAFLLLALIFPVQAASDGDRLLGIWITPEKDRIQIYKTGERYFGKPAVQPGQAQRLDVNNPDPAKRGRSLADVLILENFIYEDGEWSRGKIYDPKNGKTYSCVIRLKGENEIVIRGYVGISLFGRSETWTRAGKNP